MTTALPTLHPSFSALARIECEVAGLVTLGPAPLGERRYVPLLGGRVHGSGLNGRIEPGGVDWQILRADGVLEIAAHYVIRTDDDALIEVDSRGLRHGPPEVMARLARGEPVPGTDYFFRTVVRFTTGAPAWQHLNTVMALALGQREATRVVLDLYRIE